MRKFSSISKCFTHCYLTYVQITVLFKVADRRNFAALVSDWKVEDSIVFLNLSCFSLIGARYQVGANFDVVVNPLPTFLIVFHWSNFNTKRDFRWRRHFNALLGQGHMTPNVFYISSK